MTTENPFTKEQLALFESRSITDSEIQLRIAKHWGVLTQLVAIIKVDSGCLTTPDELLRKAPEIRKFISEKGVVVPKDLPLDSLFSRQNYQALILEYFRGIAHRTRYPY